MEKYSNIPVYKIAITLKEQNAEINRGFVELIEQYVLRDLLDYHKFDINVVDYADIIRIGIWKAREYEGQTALVDFVRDNLMNMIMRGLAEWLDRARKQGRRIHQKHFENTLIRKAHFLAKEWYRPRAMKRDPETTFLTPEEAEEIGKEKYTQHGEDLLEDFIDDLLDNAPLAREWLNSNQEQTFRDFAINKGYNPRTSPEFKNALVAALGALLRKGYENQEAGDFLGYTGGAVSKLFRRLKDAKNQFVDRYLV